MQASSIRSAEKHPRQPFVDSDWDQDEDEDDDVQDVPRPASGMTRRNRKFEYGEAFARYKNSDAEIQI